MSREFPRAGETLVLERPNLQDLLDVLARSVGCVIGPTVRDRAVVHREVTRVEDLPVGWTDEQGGGAYRLRRREDPAVFGHVVGPHSWKNILYPYAVREWKGRRGPDGFELGGEETGDSDVVFLGVRACDLHAIRIQDRILIEGPHADPGYARRRGGVWIVAVNCTEAHGTCFCASMGTGPRVDSGFDLALTEILEGDRHVFLVEVGSERAGSLLGEVPHRAATEEDRARARALVARAVSQMGRTMEAADLKDLLYRNYDHCRWDEVVERCLMCGNCTMVCPTCFCSTVADVTDVSGTTTERWRRLDSCFTLDFSYIHGGSVRTSTCSRYRQWMVHKLAAWIDQFGTSGCVGCGRCITWCPVGIDITEEVAAIRGIDPGAAGTSSKE